jgi:hypothetical protein
MMSFRPSLAARRRGFLVGALVFLAAVSMAAPSAPPTKWPVLELKGGRVLHNVKLISDETDSIVVRADEGLVKVAKATLPASVAAFYPVKTPPQGPPEMMMEPFNSDPAGAVRAQEPIAKPDAKLPDHTVYKGCTIVSFQPKAYQTVLGCAEVVVRNDTDAPVEIYPGDFSCVASLYGRLVGRSILVEGDPPGRKHKEIVPPHGNVDDLLTFTNQPIEILSVQWTQ